MSTKPTLRTLRKIVKLSSDQNGSRDLSVTWCGTCYHLDCMSVRDACDRLSIVMPSRHKAFGLTEYDAYALIFKRFLAIFSLPGVCPV